MCNSIECMIYEHFYFQYREKLIKESAQLFIRRKQLIRELATYIYPITEVFIYIHSTPVIWLHYEIFFL